MLSCWALVTAGADILTVFAGAPATPRQSEWDRLCGFASSAESIPARRREEERALAGLDGRRRLLDLPDDEYAQRPRPQADADQIVEAVAAWRRGGDGHIAIPAGAGWRPGRLRRLGGRLHLGRWLSPPHARPHADHLYVRDALLASEPLMLYEELPYLWGGSVDAEIARIAVQTGRKATALVLPVDREDKAARLAAYESQLPHLSPPDRGRLDVAAELPPVERYWLIG